MFLAAIEKVNDDFDNNLRILRIESLSALRSSLFGKSMEPFYNKCNAESGTFTHRLLTRLTLQAEEVMLVERQSSEEL